MIGAGIGDVGIMIVRIARFRFALVSLAACALLVACSGGTICTRVIEVGGGQATCSGSIERLSGRQLLTFKLKDIALGASIEAHVSVSVTGGVVTVAYRNGSGESVVYAVSPGSPLSFQDKLRVIFIDEAEITLEAAGGNATGIQYLAEFRR